MLIGLLSALAGNFPSGPGTQISRLPRTLCDGMGNPVSTACSCVPFELPQTTEYEAGAKLQ
eukprot:4333488-Pleurochrysis_carterae.AAC.2